LKNINIDTTITVGYKPENVGIFGYIRDGEFKNINVDYGYGSIKANSSDAYIYAGGFVGSASGTFSNITLNNIGSIIVNSGSTTQVGGFAGWITSGTFSNITINNIGNISTKSIVENSTGGFAGHADGNFLNITINSIGNISAITKVEPTMVAGGFAGHANGTFSNITLNNIGSISAIKLYEGPNDYEIYKTFAGGFAGTINGGTFSNIYIYFNPKATITATYKDGNVDIGKFGGGFWEYASGSSNTTLSNINLYYANNQFSGLENIGYKSDKATIIGENEIKYSGKTFEAFKDKILKEGAFKDEEGNPITIYKKEYEEDGKKKIYFTFIDESNMDNGSNSGSNGNGDNGNDSNFTDINKDGLNDVTLSGNDFSKEILDLILKDFYNEKIIIDLQKS
ncbi:hypothetical protein B6S12_10585, partial [Helicobacter valdiviensis]